MVQERATASSGTNEESACDDSADDKEWVSLAEFAKIIGVTYQTALRYKEQKKISTIQVGGRFRVYKTELDRFQKDGNDKGKGEA